MKCTVYETGKLKQYKFSVIFARYQNKWIVCKHRDRDTWETSGGHIEPGETPLDAAKRELYEETGAVDFTITPVCDYWACDEPHETENLGWSNGRVFLADVTRIGKLPDSEMERIEFFDEFPDNLTYPDITYTLLPHVMGKIETGKGTVKTGTEISLHKEAADKFFKGRIPRFEFGEGKLSAIGKAAKKYGRKAILTIDPFLDSGGAGKKIIRLLAEEGIDVVSFAEIEPNPSCFAADRAAQIARDSKADMVIAAGGGSAIDFGKAVSVIAVNPGSSWDYTERSDHKILRPETALPLIALPSTSGTGSEATPFAVLNNTSIREKSTIVSERIYAAEAIIDPELTYTMPRRLTASTGFDAFAHCLESFISLEATPFTRMAAREGMRIIAENLPRAAADGADREARAGMAWGSLLGGAAISCIGVVLPHSLGQPVGGFCGAPHGESVAACMVEVLKISYGSNIAAFAEISRIMDPSTESLPPGKRAAACPELVQKFLDDIGLKIRFSDFGLGRGDIDKVTAIAMTGYYFDIKNHPLAVTEADIKELYGRCL